MSPSGTHLVKDGEGEIEGREKRMKLEWALKVVSVFPQLTDTQEKRKGGLPNIYLGQTIVSDVFQEAQW